MEQQTNFTPHLILSFALLLPFTPLHGPRLVKLYSSEIKNMENELWDATFKLFCLLLYFSANLWGPVTRTGGQNIVPTYKPTEAQSSYVQLLEAQIKSANCSVKNLRVKFKCKTWKQCAWSILMKPLKGINMLGNCWISPFLSKAPFLITSQLITKPRDVTSKKLFGFSRRWVDREIRKNMAIPAVH